MCNCILRRKFCHLKKPKTPKPNKTSSSYLHGGVLAGQGRDGDFVQEELSLVLTNCRVELVNGLSPVVFLADFF